MPNKKPPPPSRRSAPPGPSAKWQFWLDRGGTFIDIIARAPDGSIHTDKVLSDNIAGGLSAVRRWLGLPAGARIPAAQVAEIRIGMTISTNMLLERKGTKHALAVTRGFADILKIGDQTRPALFSLNTHRPPPLTNAVVEIGARMDAAGRTVRAPDTAAVRRQLRALRARGHTCLAVSLMHACVNPKHEKQIAAIARQCGFTQVICSHQVSSLIKYVPRTNTAVAEAYLKAGVDAYIATIAQQCQRGVRLLFMQSNGVLAAANSLRAVATILSGPAGGIVGMSAFARQAGFADAVGFDMGGTSTDISLTGNSGGGDALKQENHINNIPLFVPMLDIHTIAAGGGSLIRFDNGRLTVGPHSAGAAPGPACYGGGGALTITDCNVALGKINPKYFPALFGKDGRQPLDTAAVARRFAALEKRTGLPAAAIAADCLAIAAEHIAAAIRRIAITRGADISRCVLNCFGGAAAQHACLVADALGSTRALVKRQASVLSAWGIGMAPIGVIKNCSVEKELKGNAPFAAVLQKLQRDATAELPADLSAPAVHQKILRCRYDGVSNHLPVVWQKNAAAMRRDFEQQHRNIFGYAAPDKTVLAAIAEVQTTVPQPPPSQPSDGSNTPPPHTVTTETVIFNGKPTATRFYAWDNIPKTVRGAAVIYDRWNTVVVEPGWTAHKLTAAGGDDLLLQKNKTAENKKPAKQKSRVAMTEIMNSRFTFIAEKMGEMLRHSAMSVNIRDRLDFSCALFDRRGNLVANAPHIPVHLGSMSECVRALHRRAPPGLARGDVFLMNSPYLGGTHLPDLTVIAAGTLGGGQTDFYVAARGHHADIGGIAPGSMPALSRNINEEGIVFDCQPVVVRGQFAEDECRRALARPPHPARTPDENIADLRAQVAALAAGITEMHNAAAAFGSATVRRYLQTVQSHAKAAAQAMIKNFPNNRRGQIEFDDGAHLCVHIKKTKDRHNHHKLIFDFSGSSPQHPGNFNAPPAVVRAAVVYCLRLLLGEDIPLNDGLLAPVQLIIPKGTMLNPRPPAAVAAGNVEVSQHIVDVILNALGVCAGSQGTCNNLTIGIAGKQYYETVCGGMGASAGMPGGDAVQVNMTNSRATDPEILESNYPLRLEIFKIRRNSGGRGQWRGGNGSIRQIRFLAPAQINLLTSHRRIAPQGILGGGNGTPGKNQIHRHATGKTETLPGIATTTAAAQDRLTLKTPGGSAHSSD